LIQNVRATSRMQVSVWVNQFQDRREDITKDKKQLFNTFKK